MYKTDSKTEKVMQENSLSHLFSQKAGNDINRMQTVSDRNIFALSNDIIFILIMVCFWGFFFILIYAVTLFLVGTVRQILRNVSENVFYRFLQVRFRTCQYDK